jgi:hypothetical protein
LKYFTLPIIIISQLTSATNIFHRDSFLTREFTKESHPKLYEQTTEYDVLSEYPIQFDFWLKSEELQPQFDIPVLCVYKDTKTRILCLYIGFETNNYVIQDSNNIVQVHIPLQDLNNEWNHISLKLKQMYYFDNSVKYDVTLYVNESQKINQIRNVFKFLEDKKLFFILICSENIFASFCSR